MSFERTRPAMHTVISGVCALLLVVGLVPLAGATRAYGEEQPAPAQQELVTQGDDGDGEEVAPETTESPVDISATEISTAESGSATGDVSNVAEIVKKDLVIGSHSGSWMYIPIRNAVDDKGNPIDGFQPARTHTNGSGLAVDENLALVEGSGDIRLDGNNHLVCVIAPKDSRGYSPSYANVILSDANADGAYDKAAISYVYPELVNVIVVNAQGQAVNACVRIGDATGGLPAPYVSHYWVYAGTPSLTIDKNGCFPQGCHLEGSKLIVDVPASDPLGSGQIEGIQINADHYAPDGIANQIEAFGSVSADFAPTESGEVPVAGDTGIKVSGSLSGINVPLGAKASMAAMRLTSGASYEELVSRAGNGVLAGIFEVNLIVDGKQVHDGFGSLTVTFPVDAKYNGHWVTVYHRHNDGSITSERIAAENGSVTVTVTDLSTFALEVGDYIELAKPLDTGNANDSITSTLAKTGDSLIGFTVAGMAIAAFGALVFTGCHTRKAVKK